MTSDKLRSLVRKWQTLIEAHVDVRTTDGYLLRLFTIGFTKKRQSQVKKTTYATSAQIRAIRAKMVDIMTREATSVDLRELVLKFVPECVRLLLVLSLTWAGSSAERVRRAAVWISLTSTVEKACQGIYPLQNVYVRKVKILRAPKVRRSLLAGPADRRSSTSASSWSCTARTGRRREPARRLSAAATLSSRSRSSRCELASVFVPL